MRTDDLQPVEPPMSIPDMLIAGAVEFELDVGISVIFVTIAGSP